MSGAAATAAPTAGQAWAWRSGAHDALGFSFALRATDAALGAELEAAFASLATGGRPAHWYSVRATPDGWEVWLDDRREAAFDGAAPAVNFLFWHVNQQGIAAAADRLVLHAAAVEDRGRAVLIPGPPDAGKTTLAAGLLRAGLRYLTDEAVALDPDDLAVAPFPKALVLGPDVPAELAGLCRPEARSAFGGQWRVDPRAIGGDGVLAPAVPPGLIVAPRFEAGAAPRLDPVRPAEAVVLMAEQAFNLMEHGQAALDVLARVARAAPCYRLVSGELAGAVDLVREVLA